MVLDNFFENLFGGSESSEREKSSPIVSYKKITEPKEMGRDKGRKKDRGYTGRVLRKDKPLGDYTLEGLIDYKQRLKNSLLNDDNPNKEEINKELSDINLEQSSRRKNLEEDIDYRQKRLDKREKLRKDIDNNDITMNDLADKLMNEEDIDTSILTKEEKQQLGQILHSKHTEGGQQSLGESDVKGGSILDQLMQSKEDNIPISEDQFPEGFVPDLDKPVEGIEKKDIITHEAEEAIHNDDAIDLSTDFSDPTMNTSLLDNTIAERIVQSYFFSIIDNLVEENFGMQMSSKTIFDKYLLPIASDNNVNVSEFLQRLKREKTATGRLVITDKKSKSLVLRGKALMPITIIILYLFLCSKEQFFKRNVNDLFDFQLRKFLKIFIDDKDLIEFGIGIVRNIPIELKTAFKKQLGEQRTEIDVNEKNKINAFVKTIYDEYERVFKENLETALYNFEGKKSLYLHNFLFTLGSSDTLFTISASFSNIENVFNETKNNPYLLIQLFSLFNDATSGGDDFSNEFILSNAVIDKVIVYKSNALGKTFNEEINILANMNEENRGTESIEIIEDKGNVALYKFNNQYFVSFKGTDIKNMSDIKRNVLAFGGKNLYDDSKYNKTILDGIKLTDEAIKKSRNENLKPPKIISYSAGSISASMMALKYRDIQTDFYNPLFSKNSMTDSILKRLQKSNIRLNYVEGDPISINVPFYVEKYNLPFKKYKRKKFFNTHDLKQFL